MRQLEQEHADTADRKYAYDFDYRMHDYMLRTFMPFPQGNALELGCYHGEFTKRLIKHFPTVTVLEGAEDLIAIAKANVADKARFIHSRFEEFVSDEKFDAIFLIHTLEHVDDSVGLLSRIRSWLSPNGRFYVAVPNAHAASRRIAVEMGLISHPTAVTEGEYQHGHRRTYNLDTLHQDIEKSGLRLVTTGGVFFKPFANFQFDKMIASGAIDDNYLEGCYRLGTQYPDLCASIFAVCK